MKVIVRLYGTLRRFSNPNTPGVWVGIVPEKSQIKYLVEILQMNINEIALSTGNGIVLGMDDLIPCEGEIILVSHVGAG